MFYFTPLPGFFSPFPHGTSSLSVTKQYLALRDGPRSFIRDFSCLVLLWNPLTSTFLSYTGLSPSMVCFPKTFLLELLIVYRGPNPRCITTSGLGSSYFARHYFRNHCLFSLPMGTKMFQFPTFPSHTLLYSCMDT